MDCYTRPVLETFVEAMFTEVQTLRQIQSSLDGDLHQYIQWIIVNRPNETVPQTGSPYKQVLQNFLRDTKRNSHPYKRVFRKFYAARHSNHTTNAMADFVSEVEYQQKLHSSGADENLTPL